MKPRYDAVVVGAGMGGLLSAAYLTRRGYRTALVERLSFVGGKFTGFKYKGCQIPSGAFHMLPGGAYSNLGRCFKDLGLNLTYAEPHCALVVREGDRRYSIHKSPWKMLKPGSYLWKFSAREILSFLAISFFLLKKGVEFPPITFAEFLRMFSRSERVYHIFNKFVIFADGVDIEHSSLQEFIASVHSVDFHHEAEVVGGCLHLIDELTRVIKAQGGEIFAKVEASGFKVKGNKIAAVEFADGKQTAADLFVSSVGPRRTARLLGAHTPDWFKRKKNSFLPSIGVSFSLLTDRPLLPHDGVEVPLEAERICGYVQISHLDPTLAPPGKHLLLACQMIPDPHADAPAEIRAAEEELLRLFPGLRREEIINISAFRKEWSGAETGQRQGQSGPDRYPIKVPPFTNLYMVSHDSEGWGFAGDIIGHAAARFNAMLPPAGKGTR